MLTWSYCEYDAAVVAVDAVIDYDDDIDVVLTAGLLVRATVEVMVSV